MFNTLSSKLTALLAGLAISIVAFAAEPSLNEVYQAANAGRYLEAQSMMDEVLRAHPNSAKAHFVEAELMARQGRVSGAKAELATAERLAPGLPFAKAEAVQSLNARLSASTAPAAPHTPSSLTNPTTLATASAPSSPAPGLPWGALLAVGGLVAAAVFFFRTRPRNLTPMASGGPGYAQQPSQPAQAFGMPGYAVPSAGPMAAPAPGSGIGSGILGGLATGAAVGVGMVAAESLMHRVMDGGGHSSNFGNNDQLDNGDRNFAQPIPAAPAYDMGGNDFGVTDTSSWDDVGTSGGGSDDWN